MGREQSDRDFSVAKEMVAKNKFGESLLKPFLMIATRHEATAHRAGDREQIEQQSVVVQDERCMVNKYNRRRRAHIIMITRAQHSSAERRKQGPRSMPFRW